MGDDPFAAKLRGFGPVGLTALLVIILSGNLVLPNFATVPLGGILVLIWARWSHTPWHEIGYTPPPSWAVTVALGIALGVALKFLLKALIMPLLGADPVNRYYHALAGDRALVPGAITMLLAAGFGEETVYRGYLFERWRKLFGWTRRSRIGAVLVTSALFSAAHYLTQGRDGSLQSVMTGLTFGTVVALSGRVWVAMIAHAAYDFVALVLIYYGLEVRVAHLIF